MNNAAQTLLGLGALSGTQKCDPYAVGDIIVKANGSRYVITHVDSDTAGRGVFPAVNLKSGSDAVVLEREIAWRSR